jgi:hypothetical protein
VADCEQQLAAVGSSWQQQLTSQPPRAKKHVLESWFPGLARAQIAVTRICGAVTRTTAALQLPLD